MTFSGKINILSSESFYFKVCKEFENFPPTIFLQKFRQTNFFIKDLIYTVYRFDEIIFKWEKISEITTHTVLFTFYEILCFD